MDQSSTIALYLKFMRRSVPHHLATRAIGLVLVVFTIGPLFAEGGHTPGAVSIECTRSSSVIRIDITNHRKIGNVTIEVRDAEGRSLYYEEGKAMTEELVRKLDKGVFPKGAAVLTVTARDLRITQHFTIQ